MDIETVTRIFMWCTVFNAGLLVLTSVMCIYAGDWVYGMHSKFFSISRETFNVAIYSFIGLYKILVIVFNVIPYVVLLIVG